MARSLLDRCRPGSSGALDGENTLRLGIPDGTAAGFDTSDEAVDLWHEIQEHMAEQGYGVHVIYGADVQGYDPGRLADVHVLPYVIAVPDLWQIRVRA